MDEKKPSTADILAKIRAQKAAAAAPPVTQEVPAAESVAPPAAEAPVAAGPADAKPAAPAAKPGSTKDILAAIRAKGAGGSAPAAAAASPQPAAPSAPLAPPATASSAGPRPSVQDMLKAVREGQAPVAKTPVAAPVAPVKPIPASAKKAPAPTRRGLSGIVAVACVSLTCLVIGGLTGSVVFLLAGTLVWMLLMSPFMAAWASLSGVGAVWTLATARFMFPNVLVEPPSKFKVGPASDYPLNTVSNKWKDQFGIWVVHTDQYEGQNLIFALASVCTHLGCTPNWLDGEQKFKCPCHGSGFYITGINFEGPAPRPLERMGLRIAEGMLEVDKSVKFQEEMGQWADAASYVAVS